MSKRPVEKSRPKSLAHPPQTCLLVLGMHRTGTSALTRVLSLLGAALPQNLMPPVKDNNEAGFWEPQLLANLHDEMLTEAGSRWDDWRAFDPAVLGPERLAFYKTEIARLIVGEYSQAPLFVLKDPRICRFVPLYEEVLSELGITLRFVLPNRNPLAVIASLAKRDGMTSNFASLVWLRHVLGAETATRGKRRAFLSYEDFLDDWRGCIVKVSKSLKLNWPNRLEDMAGEIESHLRRDLQHHAPSMAELDSDVNIEVWTRECYGALRKLESHQESNEALGDLSRINEEFEASASIFGRAMFPELIAWERRGAQSEKQLAELAAQHEAVAAESAIEKAALKGRADALSADLEYARTQSTEQAAALMQLTMEKGEFASQLTAHSQALSALRETSSAQAANLARIQQEKAQIEARQLAFESEHNALQAQAAVVLSELSASREALRSKESEVARLSGEMSTLETQIAMVSSEFTTTREALLSREGEVVRLSGEISALESQIAMVTSQFSVAREALLLREQEVARLGREKSALEAHAEVVSSELSVAREAQLAREGEVARLEGERSALEVNAAGLISDRDRARFEELRLHGVLDEVYASTSWRISSPLRGVKRGVTAIGRAPSTVRTALSRWAYMVWHHLPMSVPAKQKLKSAVFRAFPFAFGGTGAYRAWQYSNGIAPAVPNPVAISSTISTPTLADEGWQPPKSTYVPLLDAAPLKDKPARMIAFYLPQFHPIQENNEWWGEGFTEWTNVMPAQPQFAGHYQPHVPGELGYYDLRDTSVQRRQVELAKLYGIEGFCFYFYWFAGKRLLEKPLENWLADESLDLPFCLCWANENWSRRWDGLDKEVLIAQNHSPEDDLAFIAEAAPYLRDARYIRVDGKPLLLVYRPSLLPSAKATATRWREWSRSNGIGEIYLAYTQSFEKTDPAAYGFDAAIEFPPNNSAPPNITRSVMPLGDEFSSNVYDWRVFTEPREDYSRLEYKLFRSVCPGWDNTARRKSGGAVFVNNTPALYRHWLENALEDTLRSTVPDERLVFVNAWNEWAEGAHLEPDLANGYAYLQATREALESAAKSMKPRVVIVSHDAHPHGAQYLALNMARGFRELGLETDLIVLGDGPLLPRFAEVATVHRVDLAAESEIAVMERLNTLRRAGAQVSVANTTVSGLLVPLLKKAGFRTVSLIHELPGVLKSYKLEQHARAIAADADKIIFPAKIVQDGFEKFIRRKLGQAGIRPQGLLRKNPYKGRAEEARREVCERHGLPPETRLVLSVAYVDYRKGPDLFVKMAEKVLATRPETAFIWIGHADGEMEAKVNALVVKKNLAERVKFIGFVGEPMAYYAAASVYALTSREDPFPNVVLESAEVGVPIVAFEGATGAVDFIRARGGRAAKAFDASDFAAKVCDLLDPQKPVARPPVGSLRQYLMDILHHATGFPRVSVVVPNYNYAHHLHQRLSSVAGQTYPVYELIVLDDASTDESGEVIRSFLEAESGLDSSLIVNTRNSGSVFRQWQNGLSRCRGDIVWIAEADDFAERDFIEELVPSFNDPETVFAYSQSRQVDGKGNILANDYLDYTSDIGDDWRDDYTRDGRVEIAEAMAVKNTIPNVSAALFRRTALEKAIEDLGDELFTYRIAGDWLIYLRILLQGKVRFAAKSLNSHRRHAESVTKLGMAQKHFDEVSEAQAVARSLASVSAESRLKADAWLDHVRRHLGLGAKSDAA